MMRGTRGLLAVGRELSEDGEAQERLMTHSRVASLEQVHLRLTKATALVQGRILRVRHACASPNPRLSLDQVPRLSLDQAFKVCICRRCTHLHARTHKHARTRTRARVRIAHPKTCARTNTFVRARTFRASEAPICAGRLDADQRHTGRPFLQ